MGMYVYSRGGYESIILPSQHSVDTTTFPMVFFLVKENWPFLC